MYDQWKRSVVATARVQGMSDILNPTYVPNPNDSVAIDAFDLKQSYMYDVFSRILRTSRGASLVRAYEDTYNAQAIWKNLVNQMESSADSRIEYMEIFRYLTQVRLDVDSWTGTHMDFVLHFMDKCRRLDNLRPKSEIPLSEHTKRTLLDAALREVPSLRDVQIHVDAIDASLLRSDSLAKPTNFDGYLEHIKRQCQVLDRAPSHGGSHTPVGRARVFYQHAVFDASDNPDNPYGLDTAYSTVLAHRARMTGTQWHALPSDDQQTWDKLSDSSKEIILGGKSGKRRPPPHPGPAPNRNPQSNDHQDLLMGSNKVDMGNGEPPPVNSTPDDSTDILIKMATTAIDGQARIQLPGDPRSLMSASKNIKQTLGHKDSNVKPMTNRVKMLVMDNNTAYRFNVARTYTLSKHLTRKKEGSLMDRGANGGMAGNDVRVISTSVHRKVNVEGINLHQLADIPIVSCGGVIDTYQGQAIAIFHQYVHLPTGPSIHSSGQMEWFGNHVDDRSRKVGGNLLVSTPDGYSIPLNVTGGLAYFGLRPYTNKEWDLLPHVVMTSDKDWDPSVLDCDITMERTWRPLEFEPPDFPHQNQYSLVHKRGDHPKLVLPESEMRISKSVGMLAPSQGATSMLANYDLLMGSSTKPHAHVQQEYARLSYHQVPASETVKVLVSLCTIFKGETMYGLGKYLEYKDGHYLLCVALYLYGDTINSYTDE